MSRIGNVLYNLDRAVASAFGAPRQETVSSETARRYGRCWWATGLGGFLNWIDPGHLVHAEMNADGLDRVDKKGAG